MVPAAVEKAVLNLNFPYTLAPYVFSFYKSTFYCANIFISNICHSSWAKLSKQEKGKPNSKVSDKSLICEWREKCILMTSIQPSSNVLEAELAKVGAPLLHLKLSIDKNSDKLYSVHAAYVAICPIQVSFHSNLFSFTK